MYKVTVYLLPPPTSVFAKWPPLVATFYNRDRAARFAKEIVESGPAVMAIGPEEV